MVEGGGGLSFFSFFGLNVTGGTLPDYDDDDGDYNLKKEAKLGNSHPVAKPERCAPAAVACSVDP